MEKFERVIKAPAQDWVESLTEQEIVQKIQTSDLEQKQIADNKDHCYFLDKKYKTSNTENIEYTSMLYTITQTSSLEFSSVYEIGIARKEHVELNRIFVVREGRVIDKLEDANIKVLDNETESADWVISEWKKINIRLSDIRINDIFYIEYTIIDHIEEEDFLKKQYVKYIYHQASSYWSYDSLKFSFFNERNEDIAYQKYFFRDKNNKIIDSKKHILKKWQKFEFELEDFSADEAVNRQIYLNPYIDFATDQDWKQIWKYMHSYYETVLQDNIDDQTKEIFDQVDKTESQEWKIRYLIEYVQDNIKYVFDTYDMHWHRPQLPSQTLKKKQGDCKAKTILLTSLLRKIGVKADPVLVNFRSDFYLNYYLPSPLSLNHVIVKIEYDWKQYFIDPTMTGRSWSLENRAVIMFMNYLDFENWFSLNKPIKEDIFSLESNVELKASKNKWHIIIQDTYRLGRADSIRSTMRSKWKKDILELWYNMLFTNLCYSQDRNTLQNADIFENWNIQIIHDDKDKNELVIRFECDIINPYVQKEGKRFLMYFDSSFVKTNNINYFHQDVPMYLTSDAIKMNIELISDEKIFTKEKYTTQEVDIKNKYFTYKTKKHISDKSWKIEIEYVPISNIEVEQKDLENVKSDFYKMSDSNHWIWIDIKEPGLWNIFKNLFDKRTYWKL